MDSTRARDCVANPCRLGFVHLLSSSIVGIGMLLTACSGDPGTGPVDVKWDRDVCARCNMVLSDRQHAAQIRYSPTGRRSRVWLFDDLGCAVLWLDKQPWANDPSIQIWVNDHRDSTWIDARSAYYQSGQITPMEYGLGAQTDANVEALSFEQAKAYVAQIEQRFNAHGVHLEQSANARELPPIAPTEEKQP